MAKICSPMIRPTLARDFEVRQTVKSRPIRPLAIMIDPRNQWFASTPSTLKFAAAINSSRNRAIRIGGSSAQRFNNFAIKTAMSRPRSRPSIADLLPKRRGKQTIARDGRPLPTRRCRPRRSMSTTTIRKRPDGAEGARRRRHRRPRAAPGQGQRGRRMFADIDADIYPMADGDGTYAPEDAPQLINIAADRAVRHGGRHSTWRHRRCRPRRPRLRQPHLQRLYKRLFGRDFTDIFSGYRAFTRRFRARASGRLRRLRDRDRDVGARLAAELPVSEIARLWPPAGRLLVQAVDLQGRREDPVDVRHAEKETQPLRFFGAFAALFLVASLLLMTPVLIEYAETASSRACRPGCCRSACSCCRS